MHELVRPVVVAVFLAAVLVEGTAAHAICEFCAQSGDGEEYCEAPATWYQYDMSYEDCEVKEKCFLLIFCWTRCGGTKSCLRGVVDGEDDGCSSFEWPDHASSPPPSDSSAGTGLEKT